MLTFLASFKILGIDLSWMAHRKT